MDAPAGQLPDEPAVHCAEQEQAAFGTFLRAGNVVQNPFQLGCRKIRVQHQAGLFPDDISKAPLAQLITVFSGAAALPYDGGANRFPGGFVPDNCGFALVGDADGGNLRRAEAGFLHRLPDDGKLGFPDFVRVVLHPAGMGVVLTEFLLCGRFDVPSVVENDTAAAGGPGVKRHDILLHFLNPFHTVSGGVRKISGRNRSVLGTLSQRNRGMSAFAEIGSGRSMSLAAQASAPTTCSGVKRCRSSPRSRSSSRLESLRPSLSSSSGIW